MRKTQAILLLLLLITSGFLLFSCKGKFNKNFTLSTNSTNPYDIKFFYDQLTKDSTREFYTNEVSWYTESETATEEVYEQGEYENSLDSTLMESSSIENVDSLLESSSNGYHDDSDFYDSHWSETYIVVSKYFEPEKEEIKAIKDYVARGNVAFISSFHIGKEFKDSLLFFVDNTFPFGFFPPMMLPDTIRVNWLGDSLNTPFLYPGHVPIIPALDSATLYSDMDFYRVSSFDTLMVDENNLPVILRIQVGNGRIYLCSNPIILSNYFLLHKKNYRLANLLYKELELDQRTLLWDNYYNTLNKRRQEGDSESQLWKIINQYPGLKWAFYTLIIGAVLYFLMYARRIVQEVPILPKKRNNANAYVRTLAGVYWQRGDDNSIAHKLFHQFYEYLYLQHHVNASEVKEENIDRISNKIGKSPDAFRNVLNALQDYNKSKKITKEQLNNYYKNLSIFYNS